MRLNCCVGVTNQGRGNKGSGTRWKLNYKPKVPKDQVATAPGVKIPKGGDGTPSLGQVVLVCMGRAHRLLAKVKRAAWKVSNGAVIITLKAGSLAALAGLFRLARPRPCSLNSFLHVRKVAFTIGGVGSCDKASPKACGAGE